MNKALILDTHVLLWYINEPKLLPKILLDAIQNYDEIYVSAISCFEIVWLIEHNRITLPNTLTFQQWFQFVRKQTDITFLDLTPSIAERAVLLPEHHKDPMDRFIIATALDYGYDIASVDKKFPLYQELNPYLIK